MNKKERLVFRNMRRGLRIPQAALAKETGILLSRINAWERGAFDLTPDEEDRIGNAIDAVLVKRGIPGKVTPEQAQEDSREGSVLARLRDQYGITQTELENEAKIKQSNISSFEKGLMDLSPDKVAQLFRGIDSIVEKRGSRVGNLANLLPPKNPQEYEKWRDRMMVRSSPNLQLEVQRLKEQNRVLQELVAIQQELISLYPELMKEGAAEKDAKILELEKKVKDLRELYDAGTVAVVASERYETLRDQVLADGKKEK